MAAVTHRPQVTGFAIVLIATALGSCWAGEQYAGGELPPDASVDSAKESGADSGKEAGDAAADVLGEAAGSGGAGGSAPSTCPNGQCDNGETCASCATDCGQCCPNGACDNNETCASCPSDCGACCPNGACDTGETCQTCPDDCGGCCPNGACDNGETCASCPGDCGGCCGNGACDYGETCLTCGDCPPCVCGDNACNGNETCQTCWGDCGCGECYARCCDGSLQGPMGTPSDTDCFNWGGAACGSMGSLLRTSFNGAAHDQQNRCWVRCCNYSTYHLLPGVLDHCSDAGVSHCQTHGGFDDVIWQACDPNVYGPNPPQSC